MLFPVGCAPHDPKDSATGGVVIRKSVRRSQMRPFFVKLLSCPAGAEACGTSRHWACKLTKLGRDPAA